MSECNAPAIEARLRERFSPSALVVADESAAHAGHAGAGDTGEGTHFRVTITSAAFQGTNRVQRHRLVYDALDDFFALGLHALAVHAQAD
jgi:BolA family transcriptional regulator, general stress-responsive regulator